MHISSSYAKILGETNVQPREFPRSGSKAKYREKRKKKKDRLCQQTVYINPNVVDTLYYSCC